MMRGESLTNPPLILLHGGPGFTETRLFRHFNAPIEKSFTIVYWDQRATANRLLARTIAGPTPVRQACASVGQYLKRPSVAPRLKDARYARASGTTSALLSCPVAILSMYAARALSQGATSRTRFDRS
jgi:hypothetical protein